MSGNTEDPPCTPQQVKLAMKRLTSDLKAMIDDPPSGCSASPCSEDNLFQWNATIMGPDDSPWEGGLFQIKLTFPEQYPDKAPKVRFLSEVFHPNIYADGHLCLDIIQHNWKPIYTVGMILTSIQSLLNDPNLDSPANPDAARLYKNDLKAYKKKVRAVAARSVE